VTVVSTSTSRQSLTHRSCQQTHKCHVQQQRCWCSTGAKLPSHYDMTEVCFVIILILTHRISCLMAGQTPKASGYTSDIESGKEKFLAAQHSPTERDYVARYGQKAYRTVSGGEAGSMPQPLTPGHTATVKIKALTEQEAAAPGGAFCLLLLAFQPSAGHLHACSSSGPLLPIACDQVYIALCLVMENLLAASCICPLPVTFVVHCDQMAASKQQESWKPDTSLVYSTFYSIDATQSLQLFHPHLCIV